MTEVPTPRQSLAFALWQLADLIQADERSRSFRARAYRSAVWSLDDLSDSMDDPPETVLAVPGLGKGVLRIIEEFRATSEIDELRRLSRLYPADSARLRQLPRMTPAILRGLKAELQIETVADLVTAIDRDDATVVRGVGEATAERWLSVVSTWPDHTSMPSFRAWSIAARVAEHLRRQMGAGAEVAGEVRRVAEWVGQIVVVVNPPDHAQARSWLHRTSLGVTRSEDESTLVLAPPWRLPLTIRLSTEQDWGTDLIEATGPEEHVARIRPAPGIATEERCTRVPGSPGSRPRLGLSSIPPPT